MFAKDLNYYLILILAAGILSASFHGLGLVKGAPMQIFYSDVLGFFEKAIEPGFPYLTKNIEYPVLIGLFIELAGFLGGNRAGYYFLSVIFSLIFALGTTYFLYQLLPEENKKSLLKYWILAPSFLFFLTYNWDILAIFFTAAAFYFFKNNKNNLAAAALAFGFSSKLYPIIYLPALLWKLGTFKERLKAAGSFLFSAIIINLPLAISNFSSWSYFFRLNSERNSNPDSIWTIARFFFRDLTVPEINFLSAVLFLALAVFVLWKFRQENFIKICFLLTLIFLLTNKVFTPQYLMWLLPFFVLLPELKAKWFYALEFSNLAVLFSILPWFFAERNIFYFYLASPFVVFRHSVLLFIIFRLLRRRG